MYPLCALFAFVENVHVTSGSVTGRDNTGGVVGYLMKSEIRHSSNAASINGISSVGGVVGKSDDDHNDFIIACFNTGNVAGTYGVGGVVGLDRGTVTACYNTGAVSGTNAAHPGDSDLFGVGGVVHRRTLSTLIRLKA